jgi:uncharacterized protein (DUF427 family)
MKMATATLREVVLAETDKYELLETNAYFPVDSVNWQYFTKVDRHYTCPWKGEATFYDIEVAGKVNKDAAWSYLEPKDAAKHIKGYVAFGYGEIQVLTERSG